MEKPNAYYADQTEPKQEINIEEGSINMLSNKRLRETIARQSNKEICAVNFWKHKFDVDIENYFSIATKESRLRLLQSKFIHNIYPTNILLEKNGAEGNKPMSRMSRDGLH